MLRKSTLNLKMPVLSKFGESKGSSSRFENIMKQLIGNGIGDSLDFISNSIGDSFFITPSVSSEISDIYRVSQKKYPFLTGNRNKAIRYHYSPSS